MNISGRLSADNESSTLTFGSSFNLIFSVMSNGFLMLKYSMFIINLLIKKPKQHVLGHESLNTFSKPFTRQLHFLFQLVNIQI